MISKRLLESDVYNYESLSLLAPSLTMGLALTLLEPWTGPSPTHVATAGYGFLAGVWLIGLICLVAALRRGWRSRESRIGMLTLILSSFVLMVLLSTLSGLFGRCLIEGNEAGLDYRTENDCYCLFFEVNTISGATASACICGRAMATTAGTRWGL